MNKAIAFRDKAQEVYKLLNELSEMYTADLVSECNAKMDEGVEDKNYWAANAVLNFGDNLHCYVRDDFSIDFE